MTESTKHFISIAKDFSLSPGLRYRWQGPNSGEQFREELLRKRFEGAVADGEKLHVNLDGIRGYATSFLEEAFGGLARDLGAATVQKFLVVDCADEPELVSDVAAYVRNSAARVRR